MNGWVRGYVWDIPFWGGVDQVSTMTVKQRYHQIWQLIGGPQPGTTRMNYLDPVRIIPLRTVEEAQDKICPQYKVFQPQVSAKTVYDRLYAFYSKMYFAFGRPESADFGNLLPGLIQVSESAHAGTTR